MAIKALKKLIEDLEENTDKVLGDVTKVTSKATSSGYAGTAYKATTAEYAGKASTADYAGTAYTT